MDHIVIHPFFIYIYIYICIYMYYIQDFWESTRRTRGTRTLGRLESTTLRKHIVRTNIRKHDRCEESKTRFDKSQSSTSTLSRQGHALVRLPSESSQLSTPISETANASHEISRFPTVQHRQHRQLRGFATSRQVF